MSKEKLLCIEDDPTMQLIIKNSLKEHDLIFTSTLKDARSEIEKSKFGLIMLDINLPDGDGIKFLSTVGISSPVFIISGQGDLSNKITAFSLGAEDFITKPFEPLELRARVDSKLKKLKQIEESHMIKKIGDLEIDQERHKVFIIKESGRLVIDLTFIEFNLLCLLTKRLEFVYPREIILNEIWGKTYVSDRTVDSHIAHLRQKIAEAMLKIETVKGIGYCAKV